MSKKNKILALSEIISDKKGIISDKKGMLYLSKDYNHLVCHRHYKWNNKLNRYLPKRGIGKSYYFLTFDDIRIMIRKYKIENITELL